MQKVFVILLVLLLLPWYQVNAVDSINGYVSSSTGYRIVNDSISVGGLNGTSTSYSLQDIVSALSSEPGTGSSFSSKTGFWAMSAPYLAVSVPSNVSMSSLNAAGGGVSNGSTSWTVTTDSSGGYSLSVRASTGPALKSATGSFGNYITRIDGIPDFNFLEGAAADFFGFTPEGTDITSAYKDDGVSLCNTGSNDTVDKCWDSISTIDKTVARGSANQPNGKATMLKFRVEVGSAIQKTAGNYSATIIVTALAL